MQDQIYRIEARDIKKNDPGISPHHQGIRVMSYELGEIRSVEVKKDDNGNVYVNIIYRSSK